jgi:N-acetylmuramoyl-L-alanine amidase
VVARDVRLWSGPDATRVVIELSDKVAHRLFTLADPHRVVVDLPATTLAPGVKLPQPQGPISELRTGVQPERTLRFVIGLEAKVEARAMLVEPAGEHGHRLIVDLGAGSAAAEGPSAPEPKPVAVRAAHAPAGDDRDVVVAIDAGHGGKDPGAIGRAGTREKDVVLDIARELAARIDAEPGMRAVLTRDGDYFLSLRDRMRRARARKADLFVSIHADSIRDRDVSGSSVYVLSERGATSEAARWLAERENAADLIGGVKLDDKDDMLASVLLDLSQTASISASMEAAQRVLDSLDRVGEVRKTRVQQAGFIVLKSPDIPSMLVETAYISNAGDERRLRGEPHRRKLAQAIFAGISRYFEQNPPDGTRLARR